MVRGDLVLALDAGSGGIRAAVYDAFGERLGAAERRWHATMPETLAPFGRQYDPALLRSAIDGAITSVLAGFDATRIGGIAVTGQRIACVWTDEAGEVLYAGPNGDVRAIAGADLDDLDPEEIYERTGRFPPWIFAPGRLRWFAQNEPETFSRIRHVLGLPNWLAFELTGVAGTDATIAADLMMLDVPRRARHPIPTGSLPDEVWPELESPWQTLGELRQIPAERWGLRKGVPVAVGCADTQAALPFGGTDTLVAGSSAPLLRTLNTPSQDPKRRLWLDPHLDDDGWCLEANLGEMGTVHRWLAALIQASSFEAFDALAREAPLGCRGASAHLGPRAMDLRNLNTGRPAALLMPFGETSLSSPPGRAEIARSHLESCAFATRAGREWLDEVAPAPTTLHLVGGLSRSELFAGVLASVLEVPVSSGPWDATARGAAACGLVVAGLSTTWPEAVARCAREPVVYEPTADYEDAYERWLDREEQLEEM